MNAIKDSPVPTARRKAISTSLNGVINDLHDHNITIDSTPSSSPSSSSSSSVAAPPPILPAPIFPSPLLPPVLPVKAKRPKRISATFGGPGSISGSDSGSGSASSYSASTPSLPSPLSPLFTTMTHSPVALTATATNSNSNSNNNDSAFNSTEDPLHIRQHPLATEPSSPLISGTFGLYPPLPFRKAMSVMADDMSIASSIWSNNDSINRGGEGGSTQDQKSWSLTAGNRARFTFGYDDTLQEEDVLKILSSPEQFNNSSSSNHGNINNNNSNSNINKNNNNNNRNGDTGQDGGNGNQRDPLPTLPPLPLTSTVRTPRLPSTPSQVDLSTGLTRVTPTTPTTPTGSRLPRYINSIKRQSFTSAVSLGEGIQRFIPIRSSSRFISEYGSNVGSGGNGNGNNGNSYKNNNNNSNINETRNSNDQDAHAANATAPATVPAGATMGQQQQQQQQTPSAPNPRRRSRRQRLSFLASKLISSMSLAPSSTSPTTPTTPKLTPTSPTATTNLMIKTATTTTPTTPTTTPTTPTSITTAVTTTATVFNNIYVGAPGPSNVPKMISKKSSSFSVPSTMPLTKMPLDSSSSFSSSSSSSSREDSYTDYYYYPIPQNVHINTTAAALRPRRATVSTTTSASTPLSAPLSPPVPVPVPTSVSILPAQGSPPKPIHVLLQEQCPPPTYFYNDYPRHRHSRQDFYQRPATPGPISATSSRISFGDSRIGFNRAGSSNSVGLGPGYGYGTSTGAGASVYFTSRESIPLSDAASTPPLDLSGSLATPEPQDAKAKKIKKRGTSKWGLLLFKCFF